MHIVIIFPSDRLHEKNNTARHFETNIDIAVLNSYTLQFIVLKRGIQ